MVTASNGLTASASRSLTIGTTDAAPAASFAPSCTALFCGFNASASKDPDGDIDSYAWDFGDGTTGSGVSPSHTYAQAGTYTVRLTVTDDQGVTGTKTAQVQASAGGNTGLQARFSYLCVFALDCDYDATDSIAGDATITAYAWDFGDGTTGSGLTVSHVYPAAGTYTVMLTVTDDHGNTASESSQVTPRSG